jgi:hypothetical protein
MQSVHGNSLLKIDKIIEKFSAIYFSTTGRLTIRQTLHEGFGERNIKGLSFLSLANSLLAIARVRQMAMSSKPPS